MKMISTTVFISLFIAFLGIAQVSSYCANGWTRYDDTCYALYQSQQSWTDAAAYCREFGSHLVVLNSTEKMKNAGEFLRYMNNKRSVWIGGNDLMVEGSWVWDVIQAPIVNGNWQTNQPDGGRAENCLMMYVDDNYVWHDHDCTAVHDYLCERSPLAN